MSLITYLEEPGGGAVLCKILKILIRPMIITDKLHLNNQEVLTQSENSSE